ncbi:MAG: hypothetical protein RMK20_16990, partial [Verrucomicrobiales bacterium]|nr:hypothetical protein [Verrucomicrobiales bacterium]
NLLRAAVCLALAAGVLSGAGRLEAAQNASDNACSGYSGGGDWTGVNGGSGFGPWTGKTTGGGGGFFRGSSLGNAGGSSGGNINTSCSGNFSWGMYAAGSTPGTHFARVSRPFTAGSTPTNILQVGQIFAIDFDNGYIASGGSQGFALQNSSGQDVLQFRFLGGSCCYQINGSSPSPTIGFTGNGLRVRVILTSPTNCTVQVQTPNTSTSTNTYTGVALLNPTGGRAISQVQLFVDGSGAGSDYDAFFNSMSISCPAFSVTAPSPQTVCAGATAAFSVTASGAATPTYQWQFSPDSGSTWLNVTNGTGGTTTSFTTASTTTAQNGWQFRCRVTDACGNVSNSAPATLTVNATPTAGNDTVSRSASLGLKI